LAKTDRVVRGIPRVVDTSVFAKSAYAEGICVQHTEVKYIIPIEKDHHGLE